MTWRPGRRPGCPCRNRAGPGAEWADDTRALARKTGRPGATDPGQSEDAFEVWLRGRGKALYTEDGRLGFTAGDLTRWWTFTDRLRREGAVSPAGQTTQLDGSVENTPLGRGKAIADFNWDAPSSGYLALVKGGVALAPMPSGEDGTPGQYFKPSMFLGIGAHTGHRKEAAELVDFLLNDGQAAEILGATRGIPVNETDPQPDRLAAEGLRQDGRRLPDVPGRNPEGPAAGARPPATTPCRPPSSATTTRCRTSACRRARRPRTTSPRRRRS